MIRRVTFGSVRRLDLGARVGRLPTEMDVGNAERAQLYASPRWRGERREFLKQHPLCVTWLRAVPGGC
jgi:hypothetical protein